MVSHVSLKNQYYYDKTGALLLLAILSRSDSNFVESLLTGYILDKNIINYVLSCVV